MFANSLHNFMFEIVILAVVAGLISYLIIHYLPRKPGPRHAIGIILVTFALVAFIAVTRLTNDEGVELLAQTLEPTLTNIPQPLIETRIATVSPQTIVSTPADLLTPTPTYTPTLFITSEIGYSINGQPIEVTQLGSGPHNIILVGGLHAGFAPSTVELAEMSLSYFADHMQQIPASVTLSIITSANPDSQYDPGELLGRLNANGVDINRNWGCRWVSDARWRNIVRPGIGGTEPFSEPETQALANFLLTQNPQAVVIFQAMATGGLVSPGSCAERSQNLEELAIIYAGASGYRVADFEQLTNQIVNGDIVNSLDSQGIAAISILLPDYIRPDWPNNLEGIKAVLRAYE